MPHLWVYIYHNYGINIKKVYIKKVRARKMSLFHLWWGG